MQFTENEVKLIEAIRHIRKRAREDAERYPDNGQIQDSIWRTAANLIGAEAIAIYGPYADIDETQAEVAEVKPTIELKDGGDVVMSWTRDAITWRDGSEAEAR